MEPLAVIEVPLHELDDPFTLFSNPVPPVEFFARGVDLDVAWLGGGSTTASGNSFATPHLAAVCALILGSTILSNGVPDDAEGRDGSRRVAPIDRVLGNRIAGAPERITMSGFVPSDGFAVSEEAAARSATSDVLVADVGGVSDGIAGGSDGPGENVDPTPGGNGNGNGNGKP